MGIGSQAWLDNPTSVAYMKGTLIPHVENKYDKEAWALFMDNIYAQRIKAVIDLVHGASCYV